MGKKILYGIFLGLFVGLASSALIAPILTKFLKTSDDAISAISVVSGFIIFFILGYIAAELIENFIKRLLGFIYPQYNPQVQGNQTSQLTKRISLSWAFSFVLLIIVIPGAFIFTKYTDFAPVAFVIGWIIFLISISKKFKK